jgi:hypothetical protein
MLDVHPPHAPTHTWKDFFIHVGTICVGLLIAVGLEQMVEAIHHRHVREELRHALREDCKINVDLIKNDFQWAAVDEQWALQQALTIEQAGPKGPLSVDLALPDSPYVPNTGVWLAAKANGDVGLLSKAEQEIWTDLDRVEANIFVSDTSALIRQEIAAGRLDKDLLGRRPDHGRQIDLTTANEQRRIELADAFRSVAAADHLVQSRLIVYSAYLAFILSSPSDELKNVSDEATVKRFLAIESRIRGEHPESAPAYAAPKEN